MSTPFDNELMISKYMSNSTETAPSHAKSPNVEEAIKWAERENKTITNTITINFIIIYIPL